MKKHLIVFFTVLIAFPILAGQRQLTIADIFGRGTKLAVTASAPSGLEWVDDTHFYWPVPNLAGEVTTVALIDATTGERAALFDADQLQGEIAKTGLSTDE